MATPRASLILQTDPITLKVGAVSYEMELTAHKLIGQPATVDVDLSRGGGKFAEQDYDYSLKPGGVGFTANVATGKTAHLASGSSVAPTTLHLTYTAAPGSAEVGRCTLADGTKKTYVAQSMGTVSVSSIGIATGSGFFGDVKAKPKTAILAYDPGCRSAGGQGAPVCEGPATLRTTTTDGFEWVALDLKGTGKAAEGELTTTGASRGVSVTQEVSTFGRTANILPTPSFTESGARAVLKTTDDAFMRGTATFTSTQPPAVSKPHSCSDWKTFAVHTFVLHVYRGTLTPSSSSPLTALFDTGAVPLIAEPAQLDKVVYTS